jgi:hypothetical protein
MNKLAKIDEELVLAELWKILASSSFSGKTKQPEVLTYLVKRALAGKEVTEISISEDVYKRSGHVADQKGTIREIVAGIRKSLTEYYKNEGSADTVRIHLPNYTYFPEFEDWRPLAPSPVPSPSQPPVPHRHGKKHAAFWRRVRMTSGALAAVAILASLLWLVYDRPCNGAILITEPEAGKPVSRRDFVQASRAHEQRFCNCKDYVVVEAIDYGQWYVQGRLPNGAQTSLIANFGDVDTAPGTRFSVFVLSTKEELPSGLLAQSSSLIAASVQSPSVEVVRK